MSCGMICSSFRPLTLFKNPSIHNHPAILQTSNNFVLCFGVFNNGALCSERVTWVMRKFLINIISLRSLRKSRLSLTKEIPQLGTALRKEFVQRDTLNSFKTVVSSPMAEKSKTLRNHFLRITALTIIPIVPLLEPCSTTGKKENRISYTII